MKQLHYTCIICPKSCSVTLTDDEGVLSFEGNECKRGAEYAQNEYLHPMRTLTTTVKILGSGHNRLGVIGTQAVPKGMLRDCLREVYQVTVCPPIKAGDVVLKDVLGTGCDVVAAMTVE